VIAGIDATAALTGSLSGVGYHIIRLLEALDAQLLPGDRLCVFYQAVDREARRRAAAMLPQSARIQPVPVPFVRTSLHQAHRFFARVILPAAVRRHRCDLFHGPAHIVPPIRRIPTIVTIHDLAFFKHDLYEATFTAALRPAVAESLGAATAVIALSESTRRDIHEVSGRSEGVRVIYGAGNFPTADQAAPAAGDRAEVASLGVAGRYVLFVGDFNPRKNVPYLVESFARLKRDPGFADVQLVLAGNSRGAKAALEAHAGRAGLAGSDVVFAGRVSDDQLRILYRNASAFTLCSLMEGFTLVTLEAMAYGVPVVATNTSSIAEGTGLAAELVPLDDPEAVSEGLRRAIAPGARRDEMRRMGLERVSRFSWASTASQTIALYRTTARDTGRTAAA
jgi:glycosyltransferase involved in cell wall biosynthesis